MKRIIIAVLFLVSIALAGEAFSTGWKAGWKAGYCYQETFCMAPMAPWPPFPPFGQDNYMSGYQAGFLAGLQAKR